MAVAVKNSPEKTTAPALSLAAASLGGAIYVLVAVAAVSVGVPYLWETSVAAMIGGMSFVNAVGRVTVQVVAAVLFGLVALTVTAPSPRPGLKAGAFTAAAGLVLIGLFSCWIGRFLELHAFTTPEQQSLGAMVTIAIAVALASVGWFGLARADASGRLVAFEHQGWFSWNQYKPSQGRRVRRWTMLGLLLLLGCGVYTMVAARALDGFGRNAVLVVPFSSGARITLLPDVKLTLPLVSCALSLWFAYRLVHVPAFADFLIATEGELNKVSWPTKKGLVQDTTVVLVTVFLMTVFLFVIDLAWGYILSHPFVGVLQVTSGQTTNVTPPEKLGW